MKKDIDVIKTQEFIYKKSFERTCDILADMYVKYIDIINVKIAEKGDDYFNATRVEH